MFMILSPFGHLVRTIVTNNDGIDTDDVDDVADANFGPNFVFEHMAGGVLETSTAITSNSGHSQVGDNDDDDCICFCICICICI